MREDETDKERTERLERGKLPAFEEFAKLWRGEPQPPRRVRRAAAAATAIGWKLVGRIFDASLLAVLALIPWAILAAAGFGVTWAIIAAARGIFGGGAV